MTDGKTVIDQLDDTDPQRPDNIFEIPQEFTHAAIIDWRGSTKLLQNNFKAGANTISRQFQNILDEVTSLNRNSEVILEVVNFEGDGFKVCGNELGIRLLENFIGSLNLDHLLCVSTARTENWKYASQNGNYQLLCPELDSNIAEQKLARAKYKPFDTSETVVVSEMIKEEPTDSYSMTIEIPSFQRADGTTSHWDITDTLKIAGDIEKYIKLSTMDENVHIYWNVTDQHNIFFDVRFNTADTTEQTQIFDVIFDALNTILINKNEHLVIKPSAVIASGRTLVANHSYVNKSGEVISIANRLTEVGSGAKKQLGETRSLKRGISVLASATNSIPLRYATSIEFINNKPVLFIEGHRDQIPDDIQVTLNIIGHYFSDNPKKFIQTVSQVNRMVGDLQTAWPEYAEALLAKLEHTFRFRDENESRSRVVDIGLRTVGQIKLNQVMDDLGEHGQIAINILSALSHLENSLIVHGVGGINSISVTGKDDLKEKLKQIRDSDHYITLRHTAQKIEIGRVFASSGGILLQQLTGIDNIKYIFNVLNYLDRKGIVYFDSRSGSVILPDHTYIALFGDSPPPQTSLPDEIVMHWINQIDRGEQDISMGSLEILLKYDNLEDDIKQKFRYEYIKRGLVEKGSLIVEQCELDKLKNSINDEQRFFATKLSDLVSIKNEFQTADTINRATKAFQNLERIFDTFEHEGNNYIASNMNPLIFEQTLKFMEEAESTGIPQITFQVKELRTKLKNSMIYVLKNKSEFLYTGSPLGLHNIHYALSNAELLAAYQEPKIKKSDDTLTDTKDDVVIIYENENSTRPIVTFKELVTTPPYKQYTMDQLNDVHLIKQFISSPNNLSRAVAKRIYTSFNLMPINPEQHSLEVLLNTYYLINNKSRYGDLNSRYGLNLVQRLFMNGVVTDGDHRVYKLALNSISEADPHDSRNTSAAINNLISIAAATGNTIKRQDGKTVEAFTKDGWELFVTSLLDQTHNSFWINDKNDDQVFFDPYIGFNLLHTILEFETSVNSQPNMTILTNVFHLIGREAHRSLIKLTSYKEQEENLQINKQLTGMFYYYLELYEMIDKYKPDQRNNLNVFLETLLPTRILRSNKSTAIFNQVLGKYRSKYIENPEDFQRIFRAVISRSAEN